MLAECTSSLQGIGLRSTCLACSLAWVSLCCIYFASAGHRFEIKYCVTRHAYHRFDFPIAGHRFDIQFLVARQPSSSFGWTYFPIAGHRFKITSHDMHRIVLAKSVSLSQGIDLRSNLVSHDKHIIVWLHMNPNAGHEFEMDMLCPITFVRFTTARRTFTNHKKQNQWLLVSCLYPAKSSEFGVAPAIRHCFRAREVLPNYTFRHTCLWPNTHHSFKFQTQPNPWGGFSMQG